MPLLISLQSQYFSSTSLYYSSGSLDTMAYLQEPISFWYLDGIDLKETAFYYIIPTGIEEIRDIDLFSSDIPELVNAAGEEEHIVITLYLEEAARQSASCRTGSWSLNGQ